MADMSRTASAWGPRILEAAVRLTTTEGWGAVTMARLAAEVGVSRQTVYNEVGTKQALAETMVLAELDRFLARVNVGFDKHPDDLPAAIESAVREVLELARDNPLLQAIATATHGADTELLPLLTTHAGSLLETARAVVLDRVAGYRVPMDTTELEAAVDVVVRVVLSHVMQPGATPGRTAADLTRFLRRALD